MEEGVVFEEIVERAGVPLGAAEVGVEQLRGAVADLSMLIRQTQHTKESVSQERGQVAGAAVCRAC